MKGNRRIGGSDLSQTVGDRIRVARQAVGSSQGELAKRLGRTRASVSMWESGERSPALDDLYEVADVLDRPVSFFLPKESGSFTAERAQVTLRAVASRLSGEKLGPVIERVLAKAEEQPLPETPWRPRSREPIEAAQEVLSAIRATTPSVSVDDAAHVLGARVIREDLGTDALSGFLVHLTSGPVIAANQQQNERRQRFTLAHELGHVALGHHADFHIDLAHAASAGDPPGFDWRQERAANTFAANLLMPAGWIRQDRMARKMSVNKLAERYEVSGEAIGIRLETLGLQ